MSVSVTMPQLGESVSEGTVTRWLKKEGDKVEADEPLLEVSTDKVDTEIPPPAAGVLTSIKVAEDETVEVGSELAIIDDGAGSGEESPAPAAQEAQQAPPETPPAQAPAEPEPEPEPEKSAGDAPPQQPQAEPQAQPQDAEDDESDDAEGVGSGAYVTPLVRRLAAEPGVDLADVHGTGVGGRIRKQDVLDAARAGDGQAARRDVAPSAPAPRKPEPAAAPRAE